MSKMGVRPLLLITSSAAVGAALVLAGCGGKKAAAPATSAVPTTSSAAAPPTIPSASALQAEARRQRRRLPADDRELPVEVRSLCREPAGQEKVSFGALELHDVFKIYRSGPAETVALRGLDLRIETGELVALLGPSGSGKSTALHLAAALEEPSAGEVRALGRSLGRLDEPDLAAYRA